MVSGRRSRTRRERLVIETLLDLLSLFEERSHREAFRYYNGYRTWKYSYTDIFQRAGAFGHFLKSAGIGKGDRAVIWAENRPEWAIVFWGALSRGVQIVPIDPGYSHGFVSRIVNETRARLLVHSGQEVSSFNIPKISLPETRQLGHRPPKVIPADPDDIVQIVYTSGATGNPKGVIHRHRHICADLRPFATEFKRYRKYMAPFQPIRILNLLPLSHLFGQAMSLYIAPMLGGSSVFVGSLSPQSVTEAIRRERVSVLVSVPAILSRIETFLRAKSVSEVKAARFSGIPGIAERLWRHRKLHSLLGWKFWAVVIGGAPVTRDMEIFWSRVGILALQGYGLTEASPVVAVNHPLRPRTGSVGKVLLGQEVKISAEGEILVRGDNVVSEYLGGSPETQKSGGPWLKTGDLGSVDDDGYLYYRGRKKEVIVTSEGLNVYPEDIESVLDQLEGIRESAVIGLPKDGEEIIHAVLIPTTEPSEMSLKIQTANQKLEMYQQIRSWSIWPERALPRTYSTLKLQRFRILERLTNHRTDQTDPAPRADLVEDLLSEGAKQPESAIQGSTRLGEDLGLSSLDRVELLSSLEDRTGLELSEESFVQVSTAGDLRTWIASAKAEQGYSRPAAERSRPKRLFPRWAQSWPVVVFRELVLRFFAIPVFKHYMDLRVEGLRNLKALRPPLIFASNHTSHLDAIAVLSTLPYEWRKRIAPAVRKEYFMAHFYPQSSSFRNSLIATAKYVLVCALFNAYPLPQRTSSVRHSLKYTGELADRGYCPLIFPEGRRTHNGHLQDFKNGIGLMGSRLEIPFVPVHLHGLLDVMPPGYRWPKSGAVRVHYGKSIVLSGEDAQRSTAIIRESISDLGTSVGSS